jgi:hypothetical protein
MTRRLHLHRVYRHFKGNLYLTEAVAIHSETRETYVIYRPLYGDSSQLFLRPQAMFLSPVDQRKYPQVKQKYRFTLVTLPDVVKNKKP